MQMARSLVMCPSVIVPSTALSRSWRCQAQSETSKALNRSTYGDHSSEPLTQYITSIYSCLGPRSTTRHAPVNQLRRPVELPPVRQPSGPGKDRGRGVGRGRPAFLVLPPVPRHGPVSGFGLDGVPIRSHKHTEETIRKSDPQDPSMLSVELQGFLRNS